MTATDSALAAARQQGRDEMAAEYARDWPRNLYLIAARNYVTGFEACEASNRDLYDTYKAGMTEADG